MNSSVQFLLTAVIITLAIWTLSFARLRISPVTYYKTTEGKKVIKDAAKGVGLALVFAAALSILGCASIPDGTYFNDATVFVGLEETSKVSTACVQGTFDDRTTSNLGLRLNAYESTDKRYRASFQYTHHSCAFGLDSKSYDAFGAQLEYKFWVR